METEIRRIDDLDISQDVEMQYRVWKIQRLGWGVMVLLVLAILLGLTGRGPLSQTTAGAANAPLRLTYERFGRYEAPMELQINLGAGTAHAGKARVWFSREYIEALTIDQIFPEQQKMQALSDRQVFEFELPHDESSASIVLKVRPQKIGSIAGRVGLENGAALSFQHFVYP